MLQRLLYGAQPLQRIRVTEVINERVGKLGCQSSLVPFAKIAEEITPQLKGIRTGAQLGTAEERGVAPLRPVLNTLPLGTLGSDYSQCESLETALSR